MRSSRTLLGIMTAFCLLQATPSAAPRAATALVTSPAATAPQLAIETGEGHVLQVPGAVATVFSADPRVAEVRPLSANRFLVMGMGAGKTSVAALSESGRTLGSWSVTVRPSSFRSEEAQSMLRQLLPDSRVQLTQTAEMLVIDGEVATAADAEMAESTVRAVAGDGYRIVNRLGIRSPVQVNLKVRFAEVSRDVSRRFGFNWQALYSGSGIQMGLRTGAAALGALNPLAAGVATANPADRLGFGFSGGNFDVNGVVDALAQNGLVTILAEPNLTARSGEPASFLAGGEFPIPVAQDSDRITVEFKEFGVSLSFVPTILSPERISLRVRPEVSELSEQGAITINSLRIPALVVRRAETTVELGSGESFAIAGLLSNTTTLDASGLPWLSEVPVLGALFKSDSFRRSETELVIIITPYLVRPVVDPGKLKSPLDDYAPPSDFERILMHRIAARTGKTDARPPRVPLDAGFILE
ncbi:type II and III secretion system protein family protein [Marinimicrococcus flavescens]|uniref:Type II and III secretion system protein family protein n=1 Tax=Marinimicrococcus flavescens TaxID=3031815 RepID=A0AAP3XQF7_9PROT|nr:type II and III secretion system protein family protein [Marinimicrococcus flavescens]